MTQHTPTDFARTAIKRLVELQIPPTPDNFSRFYAQACAMAGVESPPPASSTGLSEATLQQFDDLVGRAVATTTSLTTDLDKHDAGLSVSLGALGDVPPAGAAGELLSLVLSMSKAIHATVKASHDELLETRRSLADIKVQLAENQKLLVQDPLTGTANRRAMSSILATEVARSRREQEPLCVVMLDLDHFKKVNDQHGHAVGDAALVHLTTLAASMLRGNDAFIRYGGEEFLMVLPETGLMGGVSTGQRLQNLLRRQPLVHEGRIIPMTFSGGVSELLGDDTEASVVQRADAALYAAKDAGRNVIIAAK
jgi:diguanylate cyclase